MIHSGQLLDGYRAIRQIGAGGFGEVWLCRCEALNHPHALKFIPAADPARLEQEFDALCKYRRTNGQLLSRAIMPIEHVNRREDGIFYIMPLADGVDGNDPMHADWRPLSLAAKIEERRSAASWFSSQEILQLMSPVLGALQILSNAELVHRDVKPDNILFLNGMPCLGDMGLLCADSENIARRGTDGYAAPKWYVDGGGHPDMYGVAVTLYVLLTGNRPDKMGRSAFRWPPLGKDSLPENERTVWRNIHQVIASATSDQIQERFNNFEQFERILSANIRHPESPSAAQSPSLPEATREEIKALQSELETARLELQKLRSEFEAFVSATVTDLDKFTQIAPERPADANQLLADSANRFVSGLQVVPSKSQLDQKRKFTQMARQTIKTLSKNHGPALCAGLEELRSGLDKMLKSERSFRIKQVGRVIAKALAAYKAYARAHPGVVRGLAGLVGVGLLGAFLPVIGALAPRLRPNSHSSSDPESAILNMIGSARRFLKAQ